MKENFTQQFEKTLTQAEKDLNLISMSDEHIAKTVRSLLVDYSLPENRTLSIQTCGMILANAAVQVNAGIFKLTFEKLTYKEIPQGDWEIIVQPKAPKLPLSSLATDIETCKKIAELLDTELKNVFIESSAVCKMILSNNHEFYVWFDGEISYVEGDDSRLFPTFAIVKLLISKGYDV